MRESCWRTTAFAQPTSASPNYPFTTACLQVCTSTRRQMRTFCARSRSSSDTKTLESGGLPRHQLYSTARDAEVFSEQLDDGLVRLTFDRLLADVDRQLTVGIGLDERTLLAARLDPHDDGLGHVAATR